MAAYKVAWGNFPQLLYLLAFRAGIFAAGGEPAARLGINGVAHLALQQIPLDAAAAQVGHRDGGEQRLGVGMEPVGKQLVPGGVFHHLAQVHDSDDIADVLDHTQVVGENI